MANSDWLTIRVRLQDGARTEAQLAAVGAEVRGVGTEIDRTAAKTERARVETFAWNEGLYVLRRHIATLVLPLLAVDGAIVKLGYDFDEAKASGTEALTSLTGGVGPARREMNSLVALTHDDGLSLGSLVTGARNLLTFGFSLRQTNAYLKTFAAYSQLKGLGAGGVSSLSQIFNQVKNSGWLTGRQEMSLTNLGIPVNRILTQKLHLTVAQQWELQHNQLPIQSSLALPALAGGIQSLVGRTPKPLSEQISIGKSWLSQLFGDFDQPLFAKLEKDGPKINAFLGKLTKGFESGGAKGFFDALDPSGTVTKGWIILSSAVEQFWMVAKLAWSVVKTGMPILAFVSGILLSISHHSTLVKLAVYGYAGAFIYSRSAMLGAAFATGVMTAATKLYEFWILRAEYAQLGFNAALDANPVGAIVLTATAFYLLYTRVQWFRNAVNATWSWIKTNWPLLVSAVGAPFTAPVVTVIALWGYVQKAWSWINGEWPKLAGVVTAPFSAAWGVYRGFYSWVYSHTLKPVVSIGESGVITVWNDLKRFYSWLGNHVFTLRFEQHLPGSGLVSAALHPLRTVQQGLNWIPGLAGGGTIEKPGLVLVGERGPELLSLKTGATVTPLAGPRSVTVATVGDNREQTLTRVARPRVVPILAPGVAQRATDAPDWLDLLGEVMVRAMERVRIETLQIKQNGQAVAEVAFAVKETAEARA